MVSCLDSAALGDCEDVESIASLEKCSPKKKKSFDCRKVCGSDHLKMKRARRFRCPSKRILSLAEPKWVTTKCCEIENVCQKKVEVVRPGCEQTPVRIKMLAYPKVRKLVASRHDYKRIVDKEWCERFESLIHRSMLTMYSRLANVQAPCKTERKGWTREDWRRHCKWLKERAIPKRIKLPPLPKRKRVPLESLEKSINELSKPRERRPRFSFRCGYVSVVKHGALLYKPTERIRLLAVPKRRREDFFDDDEQQPFAVKPNALTYTPTDRIKMLAIAKSFPTPKQDEIETTQFGIPKRALKASASQRVLDLAKPKESKNEDEEEKDEKPLVSKAALKAKPTPRILELAKPRNPVEKFKPTD